MKKILAFITATIIFCLVVLLIHNVISNNNDMKTAQMGSWTNPYKYLDHQAVVDNLDKNTMPVFGSSEFNHGRNTIFHITSVFKNQKMTPMIMGSAYSQSLTHSIALASMEPNMKLRKAVLIVSPTWFSPHGVKPEQFKLRFSESDYVSMLKNKDLSRKLRLAMVNRTMALYKGDSSMTKTLENYNDVYLYHKNTYFEKKFCNIRQSFINDRDNISVLAAMKLSNISPGMKKHISDDPPDWGSLEHKSELYSASRSTNKFFMYDKAYAKSFKKKVFSQRRMNKHRNLTISREYYDLSCFLKICKESKIKPLIIILPMNGYWYDHVGFPIERRLNFDNKVKEEAKDYGASIADFTYDEYNPYFMEDAVHLSAKGWVKVNESIFKFYKNDN